MTSRERTEALLFMAGTLLLMLGLQWMTRVMLLSVATVETYWWLELVGLAAGIALAGIGYFTAEPFGKVAMAWLLVTAGLIWGIGPLVTSPEQAKWLPLVPRGAAWAIETLGQGTLDVLLGRRDPAFWPPRTARASLAGVLLAVFALPLALRLTEAAARELRPSKRHRGGNRYRSTETVFGDADWGTWAAMRKTVSDPGGIVGTVALAGSGREIPVFMVSCRALEEVFDEGDFVGDALGRSFEFCLSDRAKCFDALKRGFGRSEVSKSSHRAE